MKTNKLSKVNFMLLVSLTLFSSCDIEDINELQQGGSKEIGAYAKIVTSSPDKSVNLFSTGTSKWNATVEFIDESRGSLVDSYSLYATFRDNTIADETAPNHSIKKEVLISTWDKSSFESGDNYPNVSFEVTANDVIGKLNLDLTVVEGGDALKYRGEIKLSDGRTFSTSNSGKSITSELFYNDAFGFSSTFVCIPASPIVGDWKIDIYDVYGDGWDKAKIVVTLDGVEMEFTSDAANGKNVTSFILNVPSGTATLTWKYVPGNFEEEHKFEIYAPSGNLVLKDGPNPATGPMALNLCNE